MMGGGDDRTGSGGGEDGVWGVGKAEGSDVWML